MKCVFNRFKLSFVFGRNFPTYIIKYYIIKYIKIVKKV